MHMFQSSSVQQQPNPRPHTCSSIQPWSGQDPWAGLCWCWTGTLTEPELLYSWGQDVCLWGSDRARGNTAQNHGTLRGSSDLLLGPVSAE